jgi:hypothetical protein
MHLLKIPYEPEKHTVSQDASVEKQRDEIEERIADNPNLRGLLTDPDLISRAYRLAVQDAVRETGLPKETFPGRVPMYVRGVRSGIDQDQRSLRITDTRATPSTLFSVRAKAFAASVVIRRFWKTYLVSRPGLEPGTIALKVRCSTN